MTADVLARSQRERQSLILHTERERERERERGCLPTVRDTVFQSQVDSSKRLKMVLDAALLNAQHYKGMIKGKVEQSYEWSSALLYNSVWYYLPTPPLGQDMTQGQFFKRSLTGLNSEFSFS